MTIDETIEQQKRFAESARLNATSYGENYAESCERWAYEHEQIIEWLEELKELRKWKEQTCDKFYNKAIADVKRVITESTIPRHYQDTVCRLIDNEFGKGEEDEQIVF